MTNPRTTADAFGDAAAAMVGEHTAADVLARLLQDCAELLSADAVAVMMLDEGGELSLVSSSSHRAGELEMLQIQRSAGPCVSAIRSGRRVTSFGAEALTRRWGTVGRDIVEAGFESVDAHPMWWQGQLLGGLNVFRRHAGEIPEQAATLSRAFADVATLVVVQSTGIPADEVQARVHAAIRDRAQVEQAKGVLAYVLGIDMTQAYDELRRLAGEQGTSLVETALRVVREQNDGADT
jgi:hypothetical protein